MIVITGVAGFISSVVLGRLNQIGREDIILVDDFSKPEKNKNFEQKKFQLKIDREQFIDWFSDHANQVDFVIHLGARTDTTEFDRSIFDKLNNKYSEDIWNICTQNNIPLIYASSGATYGGGELGYDDKHDIINDLKPLNPYGESKNDFDKWVLKQEKTPPFWAGLKFFNVYGPNEYHKSRMASVVFHTFNQVQKTGGMKLFRSHNPNYKDGEQLRDFIYVKDVTNVILFLMENAKPENSAIYNLGTGQARTFYDLAANTFKALGLDSNISFVDTPEDIRDKYQYFTEANMTKLRSIGYVKEFTSLEDGVKDYVQQYLMSHNYA